MYFNYLKEEGSDGCRVRQRVLSLSSPTSQEAFAAVASEYHNLMLLAEHAHEQLSPIKALGSLRKAMALGNRYPLRRSGGEVISVDTDPLPTEDFLISEAAEIMKRWKDVYVDGRPVPPGTKPPKPLPRDAVMIYDRLAHPSPALTAVEGRTLFNEYLLMEHLRLSTQYMGAYLSGLDLIKNLRMPSEKLNCFNEARQQPSTGQDDTSRKTRLRAALASHPGLQMKLKPLSVPPPSSIVAPPHQPPQKQHHPFFNAFASKSAAPPPGVPSQLVGAVPDTTLTSSHQPTLHSWGSSHQLSHLNSNPSPTSPVSPSTHFTHPSATHHAPQSGGVSLIGTTAIPPQQAPQQQQSSYRFGRTAEMANSTPVGGGGAASSFPRPTEDGPSLQQQATGFISARDQLSIDVKAGRAHPSSLAATNSTSGGGSNAANNRRLGLRRPPFTPPIAQPPNGSLGMDKVMSATVQGSKQGAEDEEGAIPAYLLNEDGSIPHQLEGLDPKLITQVANEILDRKGSKVDWSDIAGLEHAKQSIEEAIVWPLRRPDLFVGLRDPPRGLLLFGPPGTGKTMIARAIASRAQCTFMNISSSSLMSKWIGDGEKLVRCMFAVAAVRQPTVIFIDEIDSLLSARTEGEQDAMRRVKTEFLVHMDGVATNNNERVLLIGATNRPEELDEAARRRMEKRLYIPLPDEASRRTLIQRLITSYDHGLTDQDFDKVGRVTDQYSGADVKHLCREAAMGPLRSCTKKLSESGDGPDPAANGGMGEGADIASLATNMIRPIQLKDFKAAMKLCKPSVGQSELARYEAWNNQYGSFNAKKSGAEIDSDSSCSSAWGE